VIRRLRPGDENLHVELARRFKEHAPTLEQSREFLADERNWLLVAEMDNGDAVGFALAYRMERWDGRSMVFFYEIEVAAACRSQGFGRALVEELLRLARASGAYKLWVQTDEVNMPAMRLYESCGATRRTPDDVMWGWAL
jgi:ribosomal protein S18 acetylase RimI-like enzyme